MKISQREKILIVVALFALAAFGYVWFLHLPQQSRIASLQINNQQLLQEQHRLAAIRQQQERKTPVDESKDLAMVKERLPVQEEMIPVLRFLDESTSRCGVDLASLEYRGAKENEDDARTLTFAVDTSGSIFDLIDFLQELLAAPRFISVDGVSLSACKAKRSSDTMVEERVTPVYYIAPPGMPQAKLEQVRVAISEEPPAEKAAQRVAESFIPDEFDMKITINAYYSPDKSVGSASADGEAGDEAVGTEADGNADSEGRI